MKEPWRELVAATLALALAVYRMALAWLRVGLAHVAWLEFRTKLVSLAGCYAGGALAGRTGQRFELGWPLTIGLAVALGLGLGHLVRYLILSPYAERDSAR